MVFHRTQINYTLLLKCSIFILLTVMGGSNAVKGQTPPVEHQASPTTKETWTLNSICAALAWREDKLVTGSFSTSEKCFLTEVGNATDKLITEDRLVVRSNKGKLWVEFREHHLDANPGTEHQIQTWDGTESKWLNLPTEESRNKKKQGGIDNKEPTILNTVVSFDILGLREGQNSCSWSKWLSSFSVDAHNISRITSRRENGHEFVDLVINNTEFNKLYELTFVVDKDFLCQKLVISCPTNADQWHEALEVNSFRKFGDLWMPSDGSLTISNRFRSTTSRMTLDSLDFKAPTDQEVAVEFTEGTEVMDRTHFKYYFVRENGTRDYKSYYDADTGKIVEPTTRP